MNTLFQRAGVPTRRAQPTPTVGLEPPFGGQVLAPKLPDPCPDGQALMQRRGLEVSVYYILTWVCVC